MAYKSLPQLRFNVLHLLTTFHLKKKDLAAEMGIDPSTLTKFLQGTREIQFKHLDGMAACFGLDVYQLFNPGTARLTDRRHTKDRRTGVDRRGTDRLAHVPTPHPPRRRMSAETLADQPITVKRKRSA